METPAPSLVALSEVGTIVQAGGSLVVAALLLFLSRTVRKAFFSFWAAAWGCLTLALFSLFAAFRLGSAGRPFEVLFFVAEWLFAFLLVSGLRVRDGAVPPRWSRWAAGISSA